MITRKYKIMLACAFFLMRLLDKIYEGEDIWEEGSPWWDMIE
jgi:hypothetical protein